ncbi:hypothetical protein BBO01nite_12080 [Brevibacillus borstelensis]|nr:hypothetical protein BBO01nite_12080 [Brevibacillus borstelensis]
MTVIVFVSINMKHTPLRTIEKIWCVFILVDKDYHCQQITRAAYTSRPGPILYVEKK